MRYPVVAIEREYASGGSEIGEKLAVKLGIPFYGQEILDLASEKLSVPSEYLADLEESITSSFFYNFGMFSKYISGEDFDVLTPEQRLTVIEAEIINTVSVSPCVIIGRGAAALLKDRASVLRVFIHADYKTRADRAISMYKVNPNQVESVLRHHDRRRATYFKVTTATEWKATAIYHMFLNSGMLGIDKTVDILYASVK